MLVSSSELKPEVELVGFSRLFDEFLRMMLRRLAEKDVRRIVPMSEMMIADDGGGDDDGSVDGAMGREEGRRTGDGDVGILVTPRRNTVVRSSGKSLYYGINFYYNFLFLYILRKSALIEDVQQKCHEIFVCNLRAKHREKK